MKKITTLIAAIATLIAACWSCGPAIINKYAKKDQRVTEKQWEEIKYAAMLSDMTYKDEETVKRELPGAWTYVLPKQQSRIIMLTNHLKQEHWLAIRGTANKHNAIMDAEYLKVKDSKLRIHVHKGFHDLAHAAWVQFSQKLIPGYTIKVTGHSLGGAAAAILGMYYVVEGKRLEKIITFGQPKVTNESGCKKFWDLPLVRVVDNKDIVPLVPPLTLLSFIGGQYRHVGEEIILHKGGHWLWLSKHDANRVLVSGTWSNLLSESVEDHYMRNYINRLDAIK
jgi:triacylglycerol lipase